jgi:hypothetical protein
MTHDNSFVICMNLDHFRSLLRTETDERKRPTVHQLVAEFEESAVKASHVPIPATLPPTPIAHSAPASKWRPPELSRPARNPSRSGPP